MDGWVDGWMEGSQSQVKDCLQQSKRAPLGGANINKPKMVRFLKIKFLIILKLNFKGGQFNKK